MQSIATTDAARVAADRRLRDLNRPIEELKHDPRNAGKNNRTKEVGEGRISASPARIVKTASVDQPTHTYNFSNLEVFEVGAALVALLAYPEAKSEEKRAALHASLCALALRGIYPADSEEAYLPQPMKPVYALRPERDTEKAQRTVKRRLRDRMIAGRMAVAFLQKTQGITPKVTPTARRLSIDILSELVAEDAGYTDPVNVKTRIWRPSLPVIHLAAAIQVLSQTGPEQIHLGHLLLSRPWIELIVRTAQEYEGLLADAHFRGIDAGKLIKIRLSGE